MKRNGRDIGDSLAKEIDLKQPKEPDLDQFCNFWIGSGGRAVKIIDLNHRL